jgi:F0F1-type ATP synthase assembly protein I
MKGTIDLWVLAAVLVEALFGYLGFLIQQIFNLPSSLIGPVIMGAIAGVVSVLVTVALS